MKKYTILFANHEIVLNGLARATEYAKRTSLCGWRVSIFDGSSKIATYERGEEITPLVKKVTNYFKKP